MTINDVIISNLTRNNLINDALAEMEIDVDKLAYAFFKRVQDEIGGLASEDDVLRKASFLTGLPVLVLRYIERGVSNETFGKLALLLATGEPIANKPIDVFAAAIKQVNANPDNDDAALWFTLAAEMVIQEGNHECPF